MRTLFYLLAVILLLSWIMGMILQLAGAVIHLLLLVAIVLFVIQWWRTGRSKERQRRIERQRRP